MHDGAGARAKRRMVILGGGYAGVMAAKTAARILTPGAPITLVSGSPSHELLTRLPEIVGGYVEPNLARIPFARILSERVTVLSTEALSVDPSARSVDTLGGQVPWDGLVVATGARPDFLGVTGALEYSLPLRTVGDAVRLRDRVFGLRSRGDVVRVVIVGAGYTGVELAGELTHLSAMWASSTIPTTIAVTMVAVDSRLLPDGNARLADIAEAKLRRRNVTFLLGTTVSQLESNRVVLAGGKVVPADIVAWAAHSSAGLSTDSGPWTRGKDDRIKVDPYLRIEGESFMYAAGDVSLPYDFRRDRIVPANAQVAIQEGETAVRNCVAEFQELRLEEFSPRMSGEALSLGPNDGAAEISGIVVGGSAAAAVKQAALIRYLTRLGGISLVRDFH